MTRPARSGGGVTVWVEPWAREWAAGLDHIVRILAGFDPVRIQQIRLSCTALEVAEAWLSRQAEQEGAGYHIEQRRR